MTDALIEAVTPAQVEALTERWDRAVEADPALDPFCTRIAWQLSFHEAFEPQRSLWLCDADDAAFLLAESRGRGGAAHLEPLENMWGFASPLVSEAAGTYLAEWLLERPMPAMLLGLPRARSRLRPIAERLSDRYRVRVLDPTTRFVAEIEAGVDTWLAERSAKFRRNLRASLRRVEEAGLCFDPVRVPGIEEIEDLYAIILAVESRTWKAASGQGADVPPMCDFYARMWPRLAARGQLRVLLARDGEGDVVGYLHGALCGDHFRGLQFSYDERLKSLGLGNVLQYRMLEHLVCEGAARYDLGSRSEYKRRWADPGPTTIGLILRPV